jgi:hypothetical protein
MGSRNSFREFEFDNLKDAKEKVKVMKKLYGYTPSIFRIKNRLGNRKFILIEPYGLAKINKRR